MEVLVFSGSRNLSWQELIIWNPLPAKPPQHTHPLSKFVWGFIERFFLTFIVKLKPWENLFFKCCTDPRHLNSPFTIIANLVHNASHSSMRWDVNTIDLPVLRIFDTMSHSCLFAPGSIPSITTKLSMDFFQQKSLLFYRSLARQNTQSLDFQWVQRLYSIFVYFRRCMLQLNVMMANYYQKLSAALSYL